MESQSQDELIWLTNRFLRVKCSCDVAISVMTDTPPTKRHANNNKRLTSSTVAFSSTSTVSFSFAVLMMMEMSVVDEEGDSCPSSFIEDECAIL